MTTNSPNPVDGDVQTLTGLCKIEIKRWKAAAEANPNMRYMVTLMETALASLMAEPVCVTDIEELHRVNVNDCACIWSEGMISNPVNLYTTPPAQLLPPVELPESQRLCNGYYFDMNYVFEALEEAGIPFKVKS